MRKLRLGLLLGILVLLTAPGCRALATVGYVAGRVAFDVAIDSWADHPSCDCEPRPSRERCR